MISALDYTDFLYRPRRPEELDTAAGGGVFFNQAAHQVDILRLLAGSPVKSVRCSAGAWDAKRPTEGAYSAHLSFADGAFAARGLQRLRAFRLRRVPGLDRRDGAEEGCRGLRVRPKAPRRGRAGD